MSNWLMTTKSSLNNSKNFKTSLKGSKRVMKTDLMRSGQWMNMRFVLWSTKSSKLIESSICNNWASHGNLQLILSSVLQRKVLDLLVLTPLKEVEIIHLSWIPQSMVWVRVNLKEISQSLLEPKATLIQAPFKTNTKFQSLRLRMFSNFW